MQLVAGFLVLLTVWRVWLSLIIVRSGYPLTTVLRVVAPTAAMGVAGWALWKGIAWGYLLGLTLGGYWLFSAAWYFLSWSLPAILVAYYLAWAASSSRGSSAALPQVVREVGVDT